MRKLLFILLFFFIGVFANAQPYKTAAGVRLGFFSGISVKHFTGDYTAIEGILAGRWSGAVITGLFQYEKEINGANGLFIYFGAGAHIGSYASRRYYHWKHGVYYANDHRTIAVGVDGILGMEYKVPGVPLSLDVSFKPYFDFIGNGRDFIDAALTIRYTFD